MQTTPLAFGLLMAATSLTLAQAPPQKPVMRDAATHDQLSASLGRVQAADPMKNFTPSQGKDPSKENLPTDLLTRSDMLCFNGLATLVPKGSIIVSPPLFADRVGMRSGAKIVTWLEFLAANRGWVTTQEITLPQAEGKEPLSEAAIAKLQKSTTLVVATLQGGPISKLAPQAPAPTPATN